MWGRTGALSVNCTRCFGRSRMNASTSTTRMTINHQYSRIRSILSPSPLSVAAAAKVDQIGERQPEKKAYDCGREALHDQRHGGRSRPAGVADAWDLAH